MAKKHHGIPYWVGLGEILGVRENGGEDMSAADGQKWGLALGVWGS